jgi:hypothetical protein
LDSAPAAETATPAVFCAVFIAHSGQQKPATGAGLGATLQCEKIYSEIPGKSSVA